MRFAMRSIARTDIPHGGSLLVIDGEATTLGIERGCVWVTEENSFIDHVLVAGQRYTFDRPGVAIVTAREDARVTLSARRLGPRPLRVALAGRTLYERPLWLSAAWMLLPLPWMLSMMRAVTSAR
jgi:hypothetical protein